jgi:hypothetical protein
VVTELDDRFMFS